MAMVRDGTSLEDRLIHVLWEKADRLGRLKVHQGQLAEAIGYEAKYVAKVIKQYERDGRIKKIATAQGNIATYAIKDPETGERFRT